MSKCVFGVPIVHYLGHVISAEGVRADQEKVKAILDWPTPTSVTGLRGFLGLTGYYRRFVRHYASLTSPLTDLLKSQSFTWSDQADQAYQLLKHTMTTLPVLALPDFTLPFDLTTDASAKAVGAVLSQADHPIAFFSKKLTDRMQSASTYNQELYAVSEAVKKFRHYLLGRKFTIYTDHQSLKHILSQQIHTPDQLKWITKLFGYDYQIVYKPGRENRVADALSRIELPEFSAISAPTVPWLNQLRQFVLSPAGLQFQKQVESDSHYSVVDGLILYKNRIFIPELDGLRDKILAEFHNTPAGGHSGVKGTLARLSSNLYWPRMKDTVKLFIKECQICQQHKYLTGKSQGLLQPLPIPHQVWEDISMDFITHLPNSAGKTTIWVVVDRLTTAKFTAAFLASVFINELYSLHGLPKTIVSDRDPLFLSHFWRDLFKQLGTKLCYISAYHPESDGQTEVVNRSVEYYLRCFVSDNPTKWTRFIPMAQFWFNSTVHASIKMSPFEALFGRKPQLIPGYTTGACSNATIDATLSHKNILVQQLRDNLLRAQQIMKHQADKKRVDRVYEEGDLVFVKLKTYRQRSLKSHAYHKLSRRYFGPFKVMHRVGSAAYALDLPPSTRIHNVFHVSLLRPCFGSAAASTVTLPRTDTEGRVVLLPEITNERRTIVRNGERVEETLVRWTGAAAEESEWMGSEELKSLYTNSSGADLDMKGSNSSIGQIALGHEDMGPLQKGGIDMGQRMVSARLKRRPAWADDYYI
ncbi:hypothetical protein OROGR_024602 [Orobanche gracilis]